MRTYAKPGDEEKLTGNNGGRRGLSGSLLRFSLALFDICSELTILANPKSQILSEHQDDDMSGVLPKQFVSGYRQHSFLTLSEQSSFNNMLATPRRQHEWRSF